MAPGPAESRCQARAGSRFASSAAGSGPAGLNLAGIRRVLELREETCQLQAEVARLRELAGKQPSTRPARPPRPRPGNGV